MLPPKKNTQFPQQRIYGSITEVDRKSFEKCEIILHLSVQKSDETKRPTYKFVINLQYIKKMPNSSTGYKDLRITNTITRGPWATTLTRAQMRYVFNKPTIFIKQRSTQRCCQIILKSDSWFLTRRFFKFSIWICKTPWWLVESDLRTIPAELIWNLTIGL